jgi:hypothetical protein
MIGIGSNSPDIPRISTLDRFTDLKWMKKVDDVEKKWMCRTSEFGIAEL